MNQYELIRDDKDFSEKMLLFKQKQEYCDVVVIVNEEKIPLHSAILAANSDYFQDHLSESPGELIISNVNTEATKIVLEYCYTGKMKLHPKDLSNIIDVADILKIKSILTACGKILETTMNRQNFFHFWTLAHKINLEDQQKTVLKYVVDNFKEISKLEDILHMDVKSLTKIIKSISGNCLEAEAFDLIKRWVNHDREHRSSHLVTLLGDVQLENLPHEMLTSEAQTLCPLDPPCYLLFLGAMSKNSKNVHNGLCKGNNETLIVTGGYTQEESKVIEMYDVKSNNWTRRDMPFNKREFASVFHKGRIYIIGGWDSNVIQVMESYERNTWTKAIHSSMNVGRCLFEAIVLNGFIYVVGGYGLGGVRLTSVERYDINKNQWTQLKAIPIGRYNYGMTNVGEDIFVIGGFGDSGSLSSNECYSVATGNWKTCAPSQEKRRCPGVASLNGFIYVVGGNNGSVVLSSVERYDVSLNKWTYVQPLSGPRWDVKALSLGESIIISGGFNGAYLSNTEKYNVQENKWTALMPLNVARSSHNFMKA